MCGIFDLKSQMLINKKFFSLVCFGLNLHFFMLQLFFTLGHIPKQTPNQFKNAALGASSVLQFNYDWQSTRQLLRPQPSVATRGSPQLLHHLTQTQFVYFRPGIFRSLAWLHYHIYCSTVNILWNGAQLPSGLRRCYCERENKQRSNKKIPGLPPRPGQT